ncbi:MAG: vWA domain-containing protein [Bacteroidia bacterium]
MNRLWFHKALPGDASKEIFQKLLKKFFDLLMQTGGNAPEALQWLARLDARHHYTNDEYTLADFIRDLRKHGYIQEAPDKNMIQVPTVKTLVEIRQQSLEEIFSRLKKGEIGSHPTPHESIGDEPNYQLRPYEYGDPIENLHPTETLRNAYLNHGIDDFRLTGEDIMLIQSDYKTLVSTYLLIDISHSMVLYGEDRITPAKKVALALAELIHRKYPNDQLFVGVFGDDAYQVDLAQVPFLQAGPYHTNTRSALEMAIETLKRSKSVNRQIFLITDGKPTCIKENGQYYRNSFGLDLKIASKTLETAVMARRYGIVITTFMVAKELHLQDFVRRFTELNQGRAYYAHPRHLGEFLFEDFIRNRRKIVR